MTKESCSRRFLVPLFLALGLMCGGTNGYAQALPDACGLVARAEVQVVLGLPVAEGAKSADIPDGCDYLASGGRDLGAAIEVRSGGAETFDSIEALNRQHQLPTVELTGVGERAMSVTLPGENGTAVYVLHHGMVVGVYVSVPDPSKNFEIAVALARRALAKL